MLEVAKVVKQLPIKEVEDKGKAAKPALKVIELSRSWMPCMRRDSAFDHRWCFFNLYIGRTTLR